MTNIPIKASHHVVQTENGSVQVSHGGGTIGLLVERDGIGVGTILTPAQVKVLRGALLGSKKSPPRW